MTTTEAHDVLDYVDDDARVVIVGAYRRCLLAAVLIAEMANGSASEIEEWNGLLACLFGCNSGIYIPVNRFHGVRIFVRFTRWVPQY